MWSNALLVVISAPSGAGKTTLCSNFLAANPKVARAITCTTRKPRAGEQDGVDYYFLSQDDFNRRVAAGEFLENATVYGNQYGTLKSEALDQLRQGADVLLNIDVQGASNVRARAAADFELKRALVSVFLAPPSMAILEERLRGRGQDAPEVIARRLEVAREELGRWAEFDYLLVSATREEDLRRLECIVTAERMRQCRSQLPTG